MSRLCAILLSLLPGSLPVTMLDIARPEPVGFGSASMQMQERLAPLCTLLALRVAMPPAAPLARAGRHRGDCGGFMDTGRPRKVELVFQDHRLDLVWILFLGGLRVVQGDQVSSGQRWLFLGGFLVTVLLIALLWPTRKAERHRTVAEQVAARPSGSFPLPPIDLQVPPSPRAKRVVAERQPANVGAAEGGVIDIELDEKEG